MTKAGSGFALARRSGKRRNLMLIGVILALSVVAAIGSGSSSAGADEACPNEAIRIAQHATQLGDCRAFEKVSPADKGGADLSAEGTAAIAADDGNAAEFLSRNGFADSEGSGRPAPINYLAERSASGWATHSLIPRPAVQAFIGFDSSVELYSEDLSKARLKGYQVPSAPDSTPNRMNIYLEDTATRALQTISRSQTGEGDPIQYPISEFVNTDTWGSSDDLSHLSFEFGGQFVPAIPGEYPNGAFNAYTWDEGTIHLAGILPDGAVPPEGSSIKPDYRREMSADGSRLAFLASPTVGAQRQLYLRIDHARTDLVSESENPVFTEEPQNIEFEGMTPDGKTVFFVTPSPLLEEDTNGGPDLYRWTDGPDPEHETNLTMITKTGQLSNFFGSGVLVGMSDDGERVYIFSNSSLTVWDSGAVTTIDSNVSSSTDQKEWLTVGALGGFARVTADGNWLAYVKNIDYSNAELYLYDLATNTRICVSCPGTVAQAHDRPAFTVNLSDSGRDYYKGFRSRWLSPDGRLFFTSRSSLVPQDTNGVADVYEFDGTTGQLSLVSSGIGDAPSEFADASRSGNDVFFETRSQLVPSDTDEFVDLYDARVGGGFVEPELPPTIPCSGEACQPSSGASVPPTAIASRAVSRGNLHPRHGVRCGKNKRKVRRHGKVRCVKRHRGHRHHGRHARPSGGDAR